MCRSGRGVNQCLGVAALAEPRAATEPFAFAGWGGAKAVSRVRQQHRGMRKFARRRRTLAAFTAIMSRLGRAASGAGGASPSSTTWSSFKVHYSKLDEDQSRSKQSRREEEQTQQQPQQQRIKFIAPLPDYMSYCCCRCGYTHKFKAEELNTIVGNAFRMAYVAQLQRRPMLQNVISSKAGPHFRKEKNQQEIQTAGSTASWKNSWIDALKDSNRSSSTSNNSSRRSNSSRSSRSSGSCSNNNSRRKNSNNLTSSTCSLWQEHRQEANSCCNSSSEDGSMNLQLESTGSATLRLSSIKAPNTIPDLRTNHNFGKVLSSLHPEDSCSMAKSLSQQSTPSSDESNSPTELNSYKRLTDKPPLIKRLAMGLATSRDVLELNSEDDSCPLVSGGSTPTSPTSPSSSSSTTTRPHSGGYINEAIIDSDNGSTCSTALTTTTAVTVATEPTASTASIAATEITAVTTATAATTAMAPMATAFFSNNKNSAKNFNIQKNRLTQNSALMGASEEHKSKGRIKTSTWSCSASTEASFLGSTSAPPPLPERTDSLNNRSEEGDLKCAPWFQAGIPREITLEVLSQEPEGAFMVRESTSKPGCYALSLRVPREFQPSGIAHYLIMRTNKGYKIKGFTKEFTTLTALITHHSVMPELLPCPLTLNRYNPSFVRTDSSKDFADIDSDPDYNTLADFRKMMADLNV